MVALLSAHSGNGEGREIFLSPTKFRNVLSFHTQPPSFIKKKTTLVLLSFMHVYICVFVATYLQVSQKRVADSLELEVQAIGSSLADAGS